jgi:hypothetical protein
MKKSLLFVGLLLGISFFIPVKAQYSCPNLDFTMNNFTHWQVYTGSCLNGVDSISLSPPVSGRHTVFHFLNSPQENYCDTILKNSVYAPFATKLGNDVANAKIDALEYAMDIDSNNSLLTVRFAFVLENPQEHNPNEKPRFTMQLRDSLGRPLTNFAYANLEFIADTGLQDLACTGDIVARDWTTVGFNLEQFIGQTIKVYFEVRDGAQGNHFGYAYITAACRPASMNVDYCANGLWDVSLRAPSGFAYYKWTKNSDPSWGGEGKDYDRTGSVGVADGDVFTCLMTSGLDTNCKATLNMGFVYTILNADFVLNVYDTCTRTATFADISTVINSEKGNILWEIPELNVSSTDSLFTYTFPNPDDDNPVDYLVRLSVEAKNGCSHTWDEKWKKEQYITVYPSPKVEINGVAQMCVGDTAYLKATPIRYTFVNHTWSWEDTNGITQTATGDSIAIYAPAIYMLASEAGSGCMARDTFTVTPTKLLMDVRITDVNCYGEATGIIQHGEITGGAGGFQWIKWTLGDSVVDGVVVGATYSDLAAGMYNVEALDNRNCLLSDNFEIKQNDSLQITGNTTNAGTLKLKATGGVTPYKFEIRKEDNTFISSSDTAGNLNSGLYHIQVTDAVHCATSDTISVTSSVGIPDIKKGSFIVIYPNPVVDGKLRIDVSESVIKEGEPLIITDITGKIVFVSEFSPKKEWDVSSLVSGIYVVQIGNIREKFIKQ